VESLESRQLLAATLAITDSSGTPTDLAVAFAATTIGGSDGPETFSLNSTGDTAVDITNFAVGGTNANNFDVVVKDNNGATVGGTSFSIGAGLIYTIDVTFNPLAPAGAKSGQITFDTNDLALASATLVTSGTALALPVPDLQISDTSGNTTDLTVNFANTTIGQTDGPEVFTLTSAGTAAVDISNFAIGGANPGDFDVTVKDNNGATVGGTSFSIAAGVAYTISVQFAPTTPAGDKSANITFNSNDAGLPSVTLVLNGTAVAAPAPEIDITDTDAPADDLSISFPLVNVGDTAGPETFTIENTGNDDLNITGFTKAGTDPTQFIVTVKDETGTIVTATDFTIAAGDAYAIEVVYAPTTGGAHSATIEFATNDADESAITLDLNATGLAAPDQPMNFSAVAVSPTQIDLSWTDNDDETSYKLYRSTHSGGPFTLRATLGQNATSYQDTGLTPLTRYYYRLVAINAAGQSTPATANAMTIGEPGSTINTAENLGNLVGSALYSNSLGDGDGIDFYRARMQLDGTLRVELSGMSDDADVTLWKVDSEGNAKRLGISDKAGTANEVIFRALPRGWYYIKVVRANSGVETDYQMRLTADYAGERTATSRFIKLNGIVAPKVYNDALGPGDRQDYYKFSLTGKHTFVARMTELSDDVDLQLISSTGRVLATSENGGAANEAITRVLREGTYYVRVFSTTAIRSNYRLSLNAIYPVV
jgi:hypothetical protein